MLKISLDYVKRTSVDQTRKKMVSREKNTRSRRYPTETMIDTDYVDDLVLLAITPIQANTLDSILADLNNAVVWIVLVRPPISNLSSPLSFRKHSKCATYNWYYCLPHIPQLSLFSGKVGLLALFLRSLILTLGSVGTAKSTRQRVFF